MVHACLGWKKANVKRRAMFLVGFGYVWVGLDRFGDGLDRVLGSFGMLITIALGCVINCFPQLEKHCFKSYF